MLRQSLGVGVLLAMLLTAATEKVLAAAAEDTRLSDAAKRGDRNAVRSLLQQKNSDVNAAQGDGTTALHWATYRDDLEMAQLLIKAGASVKVKTRLGEMTPLFMAATSGNAAMIELLLKAGADANAISSTGTTSLMLAAASGKPDAVKVLLDHGADANAKDMPSGQMPLMFAAARNRAAAIKVLAEHGADLNATSKVNQIRSKVTSTRADRIKEIDPAVMGGLTALHFAAREGHMDAVRALVAAGANVNQVGAADNVTAMTQAIINANFDVGKFLLENGADPNLISTRGLNPLYATVDAQWATRTSYSAPSAAEQKTNYLDLMKALLSRGTNPNVRMGPKLWFRDLYGDWVDASGATPFWRAAQANDVAAMRLLIAAGADPTIPTTQGVSPLQVAAGFGFEQDASTVVPDARFEAVKYLVDELGADVKSTDERGFTPLHGAAVVGETEIILYLVGKGADPKARSNKRLAVGGVATLPDDGNGETVVDMANGPFQRAVIYPETISVLEKLGSANSNNCRSAGCLNPNRPVGKPKPDKK